MEVATKQKSTIVRMTMQLNKPEGDKGLKHAASKC